MAKEIEIEHYDRERIPNPYPLGELPWQVYHTVRNAVVRCCRRFGRTGAMGECPICEGDETPDEWPFGDRDPLDFFVVDDQYNHDQYIYVELETVNALSILWLRDFMQTLVDYPGWGVGVKGIPQGYLIVFADKLMATTTTFGTCSDLECIVQQGRAQLATRAALNR